jgi:hypothetical protein
MTAVTADLVDVYDIQDGTTGYVLLGITQAIVERLQANLSALGLTLPTQVQIGEEDPAYMALPMIGVCPLAEGADTITIDDNIGENDHAWTVSLYGAYKGLEPGFSRRTLVYAGRAVDLFTNRTAINATVDGRAYGGPAAIGEVMSVAMELGVIRVSSYWVHVWILKLNLIGAH